jgi:hypothetical protein
MKSLLAFYLLLTVSVASAAEPDEIDWSKFVIAIGIGTEYVVTDWIFDACPEEREPVPAGTLSCISTSMIYRGRFEQLEVLWGTLPRRTRHLAIGGHALLRYPPNPVPRLLIIKTAQADMRIDTGLTHEVVDYREFSPEACLDFMLPTLKGGATRLLKYKGAKDGQHCYELK